MKDRKRISRMVGDGRIFKDHGHVRVASVKMKVLADMCCPLDSNSLNPNIHMKIHI